MCPARAVAEELVDMPTGVDDGRHHDLEQGVEPSDRVLGGIRFDERREVADVDEHHRHLAALTGEHVIALLKIVAPPGLDRRKSRTLPEVVAARPNRLASGSITSFRAAETPATPTGRQRLLVRRRRLRGRRLGRTTSARHPAWGGRPLVGCLSDVLAL